MFSNLIALTWGLFLVANFKCLAVVAAPASTSASDTDSFTLYAYGGNNNSTVLGGLQVFYADGQAYVGDTSLSNATVVSNITFSESSTDSTALVIAASNTSTNSNTTAITGSLLSIDTSVGAYNSVSFTSSTSSNLTTSGFHFYGKTLLWYNSSAGDLQSFFYAWPVDSSSSLWLLRWNTAEDSNEEVDGEDTGIPVALKSIAPSNAAVNGTT